MNHQVTLYQLSQIESEKNLEGSKMLDFGCRKGRIAKAIITNDIKVKQYVGIDTQQAPIKFCQANYNHDNLEFIHVPSKNMRYNKFADKVMPIPYKNSYFDIIFCHSVFTHMTPEEISFYLKEFKRVIKRYGIIYLTAFVEMHCPDVSYNPMDYKENVQDSPLHVVRYSKKYFESMVENSGLQIHKIIYDTDTINKTVIYLKQ